MRKLIAQLIIRLLRVLAKQDTTPCPDSNIPVGISADTGLKLETVTSGFLGHDVIYIIWKENRMISWSFDKVNWRMLSWIDRLPKPPTL